MVVPVSTDDVFITIAMNHPLPHEELQRLEAQIKLKVSHGYCPKSEIARAQKLFMGFQSTTKLSKRGWNYRTA